MEGAREGRRDRTETLARSFLSSDLWSERTSESLLFTGVDKATASLIFIQKKPSL